MVFQKGDNGMGYYLDEGSADIDNTAVVIDVKAELPPAVLVLGALLPAETCSGDPHKSTPADQPQKNASATNLARKRRQRQGRRKLEQGKDWAEDDVT